MTIRDNPQRGLSRHEVAIGDTVGFLDHEHRQRSGQVVRLNDKTVTLNADGQKWRVAYALLHRVLNSSKAQTINGDIIKRYSTKTARVIGQENLLKPAIREALEDRQQAFRAELKITKDDVVLGLLGAIQMGRDQHSPAVIINGLVQIAKMLGFYEPEKVNLTLSADGQRLRAKFAVMSDEELLILAQG